VTQTGKHGGSGRNYTLEFTSLPINAIRLAEVPLETVELRYRPSIVGVIVIGWTMVVE